MNKRIGYQRAWKFIAFLAHTPLAPGRYGAIWEKTAIQLKINITGFKMCLKQNVSTKKKNWKSKSKNCCFEKTQLDREKNKKVLSHKFGRFSMTTNKKKRRPTWQATGKPKPAAKLEKAVNVKPVGFCWCFQAAGCWKPCAIRNGRRFAGLLQWKLILKQPQKKPTNLQAIKSRWINWKVIGKIKSPGFCWCFLPAGSIKNPAPFGTAAGLRVFYCKNF